MRERLYAVNRCNFFAIYTDVNIVRPNAWHFVCSRCHELESWLSESSFTPLQHCTRRSSNGLSNQMFVMPNGFKSRVKLDSLKKNIKELEAFFANRSGWQK